MKQVQLVKQVQPVNPDLLEIQDQQVKPDQLVKPDQVVVWPRELRMLRRKFAGSQGFCFRSPKVAP